MSILLVLLALLSVVAVAATLREVRIDGHRARPVDLGRLRHLLDRDAVRRAVEDARAAAAAAHVSPLPPQLAAYCTTRPVATRRPGIPAQRVAR